MAKSRIWNFFDGLKGDKVIWIITLTLILISGVCIFSSTSLEKEVLNGSKTRIDMVLDLMKTIGMGIVALLICYNCFNTKAYRIISQFCYAGSIILLLFLVFHLRIGPVRASAINGAWRTISVGGLQIHVYEIVKVAMVMYLAWAVDEFKKGGFFLAKRLSKLKHLNWLKREFAQKAIYIYLPMLSIVLLIAMGSGSSAVFIGLIMFATVLIGGLSIKELILPGFALVGIVTALVLINKSMDGSLLENTRFNTWVSRLQGGENWEQVVNEAKPNSIEWQTALDKIRQPYSAKIAIKQGGIFGKGPGQSTQRYIVPVMYEDYMYSFIVEEYGLFGGIVVLILYISLLARGSVIVRNCKDSYGKILVAGLVLMISGQAMLHMMVNADVIPLTGQTLPLISYGTSSFLMFCIAFGIVLSVSRDAEKKIAGETRKALPLTMHREGVQGELDALDDFESGADNEDEIEE
ncbi:MAG: FtsW/RodA/SpoVE family cell cycle protein [Bacteroidales bacterium]|nr:FtsW/RodA/SpoVE family cell cycle protein [Bacteroidales bacterium]